MEGVGSLVSVRVEELVLMLGFDLEPIMLNSQKPKIEEKKHNN